MSETFAYDNLFNVGTTPAKAEACTVFGTAGALTRGTVLGKIKLAAGTPEAAEGNTGGAAIASAALASGAMLGNYSIVCKTAPTGAGNDDAVFEVRAPNGTQLKDVVQGVAYDGGHLAFTIGTAGADSVVGDSFVIPVTAGSGKCKAVDSAAVDGSQNPYGVLCDDAAATVSDVVTAAYIAGDFNENALVFGGSDDIDDHRDAMRALGMYVTAAQPA